MNLPMNKYNKMRLLFILLIFLLPSCAVQNTNSSSRYKNCNPIYHQTYPTRYAAKEYQLAMDRFVYMKKKNRIYVRNMKKRLTKIQGK